MTCVSSRSLLFLLLLGGAALAQQKTAEKPPPLIKSKPPIFTCSEAATSRACTSFKQLLDAHDKDLVETFSTPTSYVCFRPNEDAFLIFHVGAPEKDGWEKAEDNVGQTQGFKKTAGLTEYRDGVFYTDHSVREYWRRFRPDEEPLFHSESKDLKITIDGTEISIDYPFTNQSNGTTQYSLTIRRSTGRFVETFTGDAAPVTHSGTCLVYQ